MRTIENAGASSPIGAAVLPRDVNFSIFSRHASKIEFALGLQSHGWHAFEHGCFIGCGFLFWWPVVQPWPRIPAGARWLILIYLFLATLPCDILSAFLAFSDRIVYPVYLSASRQFSMSALEDQQCAAALMWTCVMIIYLVPAAILTIRLLAAGGLPRG